MTVTIWRVILGSAGVFALLALAACRSPTEVTLVLSTNACDAGYSSTGVVVRYTGAGAGAPSVAATTSCGAGGSIGTLVVVPGAQGNAPFVATAYTAVLGPKGPVDPTATCEADASHCIVASREIGFIANTPLTLPIEMNKACLGKTCKTGETCVEGQCVSENVDAGACASGGPGCNLDTVSTPDAGVHDATVDARDAALHDATLDVVLRRDAAHDASEGGPSRDAGLDAGAAPDALPLPLDAGGGGDSGCPDSAPSGDCPTPMVACYYGTNGVQACTCYKNSHAITPPAWTCVDLRPGCPVEPPTVPSSCQPAGLICDYGYCYNGNGAICDDAGAWGDYSTPCSL